MVPLSYTVDEASHKPTQIPRVRKPAPPLRQELEGCITLWKGVDKTAIFIFILHKQKAHGDDLNKMTFVLLSSKEKS